MTANVKHAINGFLELFYPLFRKWLPYQVYAYLGVGAINTLLNIALFALFYELILPKSGFTIANWHIASYTVALVIAFLMTVPTGFWLSKYFAFTTAANNKKANNQQLGKYFLVVLQGLVSDYLILKGLVVFASVQPTVAKIMSTAIVLTINFLLQKYFTFKKEKK